MRITARFSGLSDDYSYHHSGYMVVCSHIRIHHECEGGIEKKRPKDHRLAARGLQSDKKQ